MSKVVHIVEEEVEVEEVELPQWQLSSLFQIHQFLKTWECGSSVTRYSDLCEFSRFLKYR